MKTIKKQHPVNEHHFAVVEMRENYIYLWFEETKWIFGLISYGKRISAVKHFSLWIMKEQEDEPICSGFSTEASVDGRIMRLTNHRKNIDTFDIDKEIKIAYEEYLISQRKTTDFNNRLRAIETQL